MIDQISKKGNNVVVSEKAEFVNKGLSLGSNVPPVYLYMPVEGKYMRGKQSNRWTINIGLPYCPFCGEQRTGKEAGKDEWT
ncbi:hypothetical protein [Chitinophaga ginsengisegetis]|uniref:hypothetical protein n=1 Tax=Chitinophaga ginsengisegetis TaxID=393003 RepID=UPI0010581D32|nr:hypothetical protein [Chitinophaga ginsengisegetis]MDR6565487.1 hypothetical protein [Chitinophaga ginsengisegetis]MDR6645215.1 hypothetical protein [Chitinophaga ginsengisegetis]MDR6652193.1 hypothetical protein [Chitinophaga ginsengisegetis]